MANTPVAILDDTMTDIADAIRGKNGSQDTYKPSEMPAAIADIPTGGVGIPREVNANGVYGMPTQSLTFSLPSNATDVASYALYNAFNGCTSLTSIDFSSLTAINGGYALYGAFSGCTSLTSVDLSSLTTVNGSSALYGAFSGCTSLTSVDFSSLTAINGTYALYNAFSGCTSLTSVRFSSLTTANGSNALRNMLSGVTGCTLHFPAAIRSIIEGMTGYPNFGGTNTTVLFDL